MEFKTIGRKGRRGCGSQQKGSYHRASQHHDSNNARQGVQFKGRYYKCKRYGHKKEIVQKEGLEVVTSLYSRQKLCHRRMNTIRGCLKAVQAVICQVTEAIS